MGLTYIVKMVEIMTALESMEVLEVLEKSKDLETQDVLQKSRELETELCNDLKTCYPEKINEFTNILTLYLVVREMESSLSSK